MNICGIDPSLTATGFCGIDGTTTTIKGDAGEGDNRLAQIYKAVSLGSMFADYAIVEDLPTHGMGAGKTGMAQGAVRLALMPEVPYVLIPPATVKKLATGKGNATKADMRMALYQRAGIDNKDDNQVDAFWLRQIGLIHFGCPDALELPKSHTDALAKVKWAA